MACPFFLPKEVLRDSPWERPPRAPLGQLCSGECQAGLEPQPADHELCNFGYARGRCARFPEGAEVDAVRFAAQDRGAGGAQVMYVMERGHVPVEWGVVDGTRPARLQVQAQMFLFFTARAAEPPEHRHCRR